MTYPDIQEIYSEVIAKAVSEGRTPDTDEVVREVETRAGESEITTKELLHEWAVAQVHREDKRRLALARSPEQLSFLAGPDDFLKGVWSLGGAKRVQVEDAVRRQVMIHMGICTETFDRQSTAYIREQRKCVELLNHMPDDDVTVGVVVNS